MASEGDGGVHLNREISERPAVSIPFLCRQQISILGAGAVELPDPPGKLFGNPLGTGLVVAVEDHQTDARARQEKLLEVLDGGRKTAQAGEGFPDGNQAVSFTLHGFAAE